MYKRKTVSQRVILPVADCCMSSDLDMRKAARGCSLIVQKRDSYETDISCHRSQSSQLDLETG